MTNTNQRKNYKFLLLIGMFYLTTMLATAIVTTRILKIGGHVEPGGILLFPLSYFLSDVVAEVYGYKQARQLLWFAIACQFAFAFMLDFTLWFPTAISPGRNDAYELVIHPVLHFFISVTIGTIISGFANIYLVSKWKILLKGRYFWLRSLTSTAIGELIFTVIALGSLFYATVPSKEVFYLIIIAYLVKLAYGIIATYPSSMLASKLKVIEGVDVYDYKTNFNPLSLNVND